MARKAKKRRYSRGASNDVEREMRRYKKGTAKSGPGGRGGRVKSRKQAIAIGLSEARAKGKKVPKKSSKTSSKKKSSSKKTSTKKTSAKKSSRRTSKTASRRTTARKTKRKTTSKTTRKSSTRKSSRR